MLNYMELVIWVLFKLNRDNSVCLSLSYRSGIYYNARKRFISLFAGVFTALLLAQGKYSLCLVLGHRLFFISVLLFPSTLIAICCMIFELSFSTPSYLLAGFCLGDVDLRRNWAQWG